MASQVFFSNLSKKILYTRFLNAHEFFKKSLFLNLYLILNCLIILGKIEDIEEILGVIYLNYLKMQIYNVHVQSWIINIKVISHSYKNRISKIKDPLLELIKSSQIYLNLALSLAHQKHLASYLISI